jgi:hypothetical protein
MVHYGIVSGHALITEPLAILVHLSEIVVVAFKVRGCYDITQNFTGCLLRLDGELVLVALEEL